MNKQILSKNNKQKVKVALMCIAAIIIFYAGANFLKGSELFSNKTYYYAVFENSNRMQVGNPVYVNGYKIGKVTQMHLQPDTAIKICVEILVTEDLSIPKDSKFEVASKDLLGGTVINLIMGSSSQYAKSGDTLSCYIASQLTDGIEDMKSKLNNILCSVDTIGVSLKDVLANEGGAESLKATLNNIELVTAHLNSIVGGNKDKIGKLVTELEVFGKTLEEASPKLSNIVNNFDKIADSVAKADVAQVIVNANETIENLNLLVEKINKGEGDIGQLVNNDSLYRNLEATTANLNNLLIDVKKNPKRYVHFSLFGKKDKKK